VDKSELTRILEAKHNPAVLEGIVTAIVRYAPIRGSLHLQQLIWIVSEHVHVSKKDLRPHIDLCCFDAYNEPIKTKPFYEWLEEKDQQLESKWDMLN